MYVFVLLHLIFVLLHCFLDDLLPQTIFDFAVLFFLVIGAVITTIITLPFVLLVLPPLVYYLFVVRGIFVTSTRELKRLEGLARSPIYAMMNESLSGIATIRGNDATNYFKNKFETIHDSHTRAFFSFIAASVSDRNNLLHFTLSLNHILAYWFHFSS